MEMDSLEMALVQIVDHNWPVDEDPLSHHHFIIKLNPIGSTDQNDVEQIVQIPQVWNSLKY
jgi:hypothetical protein